ncbi:hypothetical protein [Salipiger sp. PrR003]|uniref:hypothetical protein n=1 Tax=Salipiger sp. PrR003 TaxID=2706776 RepID=UPI0013DD0855|nr:hypothetical protein [Salipiger sp. PrR003]NDV50401.1 hypothetical protein [Salipiger sp. PrR003]
MHRFWFLISDDDYRPMAWPPSGPYWNSGFVGDKFVVVAYAPDLETLTNDAHWPDAEEIDDLGEKQITFTDRFPEPEWWRKLREESA